MPIALRYALRSDIGLVRANNQDSGFAGPNLLVVADGMGGHAGGDVASSIAIAALAPLADDSFGSDDALNVLESTIDAARDTLIARTKASPDLEGMGTTVTAILRTGNKLAMAHMGDSRAYLMRDGELSQVTTDHTFVQHLVDTGKITLEEADVHPQRSVVMRVLGDFGLDLHPDLSVREARPGDRWMLCSDGLSGFVSHSTLQATIRDIADPDSCVDRLVQLALRAGGPDNITCIIADVLDLDHLPAGIRPTTGIQIAGSAAVDRDRPTAAADGPAARAAALVSPAGSKSAAPKARDDDAASNDNTPATAPAAAAVPDELADSEVKPPSRRKRRGLIAFVAVLVLVIAGAGGWLGYRWTQTQYYLGIADGTVAIFQGIPQKVGPISLSTEIERTTILVETLPKFKEDRLNQSIPMSSLAAARSQALALAVVEEPPVEPTPSAPAPTTPSPARPVVPPAPAVPAPAPNPSPAIQTPNPTKAPTTPAPKAS